ncbi:vesicle transport protein USE1 isoform X4 [Frankliniella occidentalis]|uniref:Vesicle transport protein USE1 n=1 Tax=Frankliniella occidentalis TaxID=133901 RepID=A0A6J1SJ32_FRAOC|nr:vesicle transport protein USE1 isoform X4 [Frankliniella occidentalis]XP_052120071.1 vesicle transport protein USE1 isoform X2 [Frankliniella occidentalis]XP_052120072.1 vesicle transport protein USE1 isoform X3 [Frankliniella occidentalis]XP_052120073.1 vesicle transport protein USE1 isoform X5 [Frankliniella occidentalis]XP_052120074.1 vesicle transport protein USE1 isoform X6 [Frankliniella occidentalis]XP_052120075.1 vesicle transport protein USE1 isoform X7 [Frankliniella occidentalis]
MAPSRLEVNLRRLLVQCELRAKEDIQTDWRLDKYIGTLDEMLRNLQRMPSKPAKETLSEYGRRVDFLKGLIHTQNLSTPEEKVVAAQLLQPEPPSSDVITKEIHQKTTSKYAEELRDELLSSGSDGSKSLRQRKSSKPSSGEDLDALLRHHHAVQEKIAEDMLSLARNLKEQSHLASTIIKRDTEVVEQSGSLTDANFERLKLESARLEEHTKRAWRCWMWVMIAVVVIIFVNMVVFMKVMKKKK